MSDDPPVGDEPAPDAFAALEVPGDACAAVRSTGTVAGALGAAAALTVIEIVAAFDATGVSATEAVGNRVIDSFAASLKSVAVAIFGGSDKSALQIGTVILSLLAGAYLGSHAHRRPNVVIGGYVAFGAFGIWSSAVDAQASWPVAIVACTLAAAAGITVTIGLERRWSQVLTRSAADPVRGPSLARRTVLINTGVMTAGLLFFVAVARSARDSVRTTAQKVTAKLPGPKSVVEVPAGTADRGAEPIKGISPYITPNDDFYRIDTALRVPVIDADNWTLTIKGMVDKELTLTYADLLARDLIERPITMLCVSNEVGGDLIGTARWLGVPLKEVLEEAGVQSGATQVMGESVDGFTAGFPVKSAMDGRDALLVVGMNGEPLPPEHGYPVRLVVPGIYGYVSATKWIKEIRLTTFDEEGYWIPRGWSRLAPIKTSSRIDVVRDVAGGGKVVAGVAWAPTRGIDRVEVQVDDGKWAKAELGPVASDDTWVQWWYRWEPEAGDHTIRVRATDGDGKVQTAKIARPDPDGATGLHEVSFSVG